MRKNFIITFILAGFLLFSFEVLAQSKFAFSVDGAPYNSYTRTKSAFIVPNANGTGTVAVEDKFKYTAKGYWIGLNGRYSFSSKWSLSTGLRLNESKFNLVTNRVKSHNLSIPATVNFQMSERKLSPYFSAGALWNFSTTSRLTIPDFGAFTIKADKYSRITPMIAAGIIYSFAPNFSVVAQPTFQYVIPPSEVNSHTYQLGFNVQLMYRL